jgi:hypothetical protein
LLLLRLLLTFYSVDQIEDRLLTFRNINHLRINRILSTVNPAANQ